MEGWHEEVWDMRACGKSMENVRVGKGDVPESADGSGKLSEYESTL